MPIDENAYQHALSMNKGKTFSIEGGAEECFRYFISCYEAAKQPKPQNALGFDIPQTLDDLTAKAASPGQGDAVSVIDDSYDKIRNALECANLFVLKHCDKPKAIEVIQAINAGREALVTRPTPQPAHPALSGDVEQIMADLQTLKKPINNDRFDYRYVREHNAILDKAIAALELRYNLTPKGKV